MKTPAHELNKACLRRLILQFRFEQWRAAEKRERDEVNRARILA